MSGWIKKIMAVTLAAAMTIGLTAAAVPAKAYADEAKGSGKYVSDVFIAYGKTEDEAKAWLTKNDWEPVEGDFNAGKASFFDDNKLQDQNVAAVMGIKRTDKVDEAVTDMAVMNMTGGYSIADYESILGEKKAQIDEFINNFQVVINEYRANYNGEGSEFGKERADLAYKMLNKFTDGGKDEEYPVNDTGMKLGDLFLAATRQEGDENGGDLEQLLLESSGPAMLAVETLLALGADAGEQTWLERASGLTGDDLAANISAYVPEAEGQEISDSAAVQYLNESFGDTAAYLSGQWADIHELMTWYEAYCEENDLWQHDGESDGAYASRVKAYLDKEAEIDEPDVKSDIAKFSDVHVLYANLYETPYAGDWGETMGDFFNPADGADYSADENFLPMAAALSAGQRAAMDFLSLHTLLLIGTGNTEGFQSAMPNIEELLGEMDEISIYSGVNRAAFRGGVALTSEALMAQNAGNGNAYDQIWNNVGIVSMSVYATAALGATMMIAGGVMVAKGINYVNISEVDLWRLKDDIHYVKKAIKSFTTRKMLDRIPSHKKTLELYQNRLKEHTVVSRTGTAGRWLIGIGGALMIAAAVVEGVQLWKYYDRDMKPIPLMIVDEADVVTYVTDDRGKAVVDEKGNQKKNIDFNTYEYYEAVKCNRSEVGEIGDWNDGVEEYKTHNCFDVADLNADMGQEWIALYTVKSQNKGDPILADSLTLKYGEDKELPEHCTKGLHLFTYTNAVDLGDTAWAYNNDKKGIRLYWGEDKDAFAAATASAFGAGQMALAGIGGLILGIAGATLVLNRKRRKENEPEAA